MAWPLAARAQQHDAERRIGVLMLCPENDVEGQVAPRRSCKVLQKRGWVVGRNVQIDFQWGYGDADWIKSAAAQLLQTGAGRDPGQWQRRRRGRCSRRAARFPSSSSRSSRSSGRWLRAEPSPSRRQLDRLLRFLSRAWEQNCSSCSRRSRRASPASRSWSNPDDAQPRASWSAAAAAAAPKFAVEVVAAPVRESTRRSKRR